MPKYNTLKRNQRLLVQPKTAADDDDLSPTTTPSCTAWDAHLLFTLLLIPLILSLLLVFSDARAWHLPSHLDTLVNKHRTSIQTAIQIISSALAAIEVSALCCLINLTTRTLFARIPISLNTLAFWSALSTPTTNWNLPLRMIIITLLLSNMSAVISALWAGSLTPAITAFVQNATIPVPDWSNLSYIQEYPSEVSGTGLTVRNTQGLFTYSVGVGMRGSLLFSLNSASPVDRSVRNHDKLDNAGYSYHGRSYGVGASAGLFNVSSSFHSTSQATNYSYAEVGLDTSVSCIYNHSSDFVINELPETTLFAVQGLLPDSRPSTPEYSVYIGRGNGSIVGIGVAAQPVAFTATRYMAIAAGTNYAVLNAAQCAVTFTPARFNVSVDIKDRNITVAKLPVPAEEESSTSISNTPIIPNIDPDNKMAHVVMRQMELIANDLTSYYRSMLGDALNASISNYRTSLGTTTTRPESNSRIALTGLENAVISLVDDMLVAYASAQLMVGNMTTPASAQVQISAFRFGSRVYIIASAVFTSVTALLVAVEAIRMRLWKALSKFDYLDTRMVVVATSRGGEGIAEYVQLRNYKDRDLGAVYVKWNGREKEEEKREGARSGDNGEISLMI